VTDDCCVDACFGRCWWCKDFPGQHPTRSCAECCEIWFSKTLARGSEPSCRVGAESVYEAGMHARNTMYVPVTRCILHAARRRECCKAHAVLGGLQAPLPWPCAMAAGEACGFRCIWTTVCLMSRRTRMKLHRTYCPVGFQVLSARRHLRTKPAQIPVRSSHCSVFSKHIQSATAHFTIRRSAPASGSLAAECSSSANPGV
jgi:hypothetical protein